MNKLKPHRMLNNKKGFALAYAIFIMIFLYLFAAMLMSIFSSNFKIATHQKFNVEAYYLAYSGIEMAYAAMMVEDASGNPELFNKLRDGLVTGGALTASIPYGRGLIDISATVVDDDDSQYDTWIRIESTGTITSNNVSNTRVLYIDRFDTKTTVSQDD